jgi:hypothetical protein
MAANRRAQPSESELEDELLRLSRSRQSGTKMQARVAAIRTVLRRRQLERQAAERTEREPKRVEIVEWPSETSNAPAPAGAGYWPWRTKAEYDADPFAELERGGLHDGWTVKDGRQVRKLRPVTVGERDRWRTRLEGPPPWVRREPETDDQGLGV